MTPHSNQPKLSSPEVSFLYFLGLPYSSLNLAKICKSPPSLLWCQCDAWSTTHWSDRSYAFWAFVLPTLCPRILLRQHYPGGHEKSIRYIFHISSHDPTLQPAFRFNCFLLNSSALKMLRQLSILFTAAYISAWQIMCLPTLTIQWSINLWGTAPFKTALQPETNWRLLPIRMRRVPRKHHCTPTRVFSAVSSQ